MTDAVFPTGFTRLTSVSTSFTVYADNGTANGWIALSDIVGLVSTYTLPVATGSALGGVKQGSGLAIAGDGTLSTTGSTVLGLSDAGALAATDATLISRLVSSVEQYYRTTWTAVWTLFRSLGGQFSAPVGVGFAALTDGATIATDGVANKGNIFTVTIAENAAFSLPTNLPPGTYTYLITQGSGGSKIPTFTGTWLGTGGAAPTFSTTAGKIDAVSMIWNGTAAFYFFAKGS